MVFDDVKGCDEAKKELQEIVEFLMNPEKFSKLGGKLPKGVLLSGISKDCREETRRANEIHISA